MPGVSKRETEITGTFGIGKVRFKLVPRKKKPRLRGLIMTLTFFMLIFISFSWSRPFFRINIVLPSLRLILYSFDTVRLFVAEAIGAKPQAITAQSIGLNSNISLDKSNTFLRISSANLIELVFAQGHLHAAHKLAHMEMQRRRGKGGLSLIIGVDGVDADRWSRSLNFEDLSYAELSKLDPDSYDILSAYSAGVNSYIESTQWWAFPLELILSGIYSVPVWEPVDSLLLLRMKAFMASDSYSLDAIFKESYLTTTFGLSASKVFANLVAQTKVIPKTEPQSFQNGLFANGKLLINHGHKKHEANQRKMNFAVDLYSQWGDLDACFFMELGAQQQKGGEEMSSDHEGKGNSFQEDQPFLKARGCSWAGIPLLTNVGYNERIAWAFLDTNAVESSELLIESACPIRSETGVQQYMLCSDIGEGEGFDPVNRPESVLDSTSRSEIIEIRDKESHRDDVTDTSIGPIINHLIPHDVSLNALHVALNRRYYDTRRALARCSCGNPSFILKSRALHSNNTLIDVASLLKVNTADSAESLRNIPIQAGSPLQNLVYFDGLSAGFVNMTRSVDMGAREFDDSGGGLQSCNISHIGSSGAASCPTGQEEMSQGLNDVHSPSSLILASVITELTSCLDKASGSASPREQDCEKTSEGTCLASDGKCSYLDIYENGTHLVKVVDSSQEKKLKTVKGFFKNFDGLYHLNASAPMVIEFFRENVGSRLMHAVMNTTNISSAAVEGRNVLSLIRPAFQRVHGLETNPLRFAAQTNYISCEAPWMLFLLEEFLDHKQRDNQPSSKSTNIRQGKSSSPLALTWDRLEESLLGALLDAVASSEVQTGSDIASWQSNGWKWGSVHKARTLHFKMDYKILQDLIAPVEVAAPGGLDTMLYVPFSLKPYIQLYPFFSTQIKFSSFRLILTGESDGKKSTLSAKVALSQTSSLHKEQSEQLLPISFSHI